MLFLNMAEAQLGEIVLKKINPHQTIPTIQTTIKINTFFTAREAIKTVLKNSKSPKNIFVSFCN